MRKLITLLTLLAVTAKTNAQLQPIYHAYSESNNWYVDRPRAK